MLLTFLKLHAKQLGRFSQELGIIRSLIVLVLLAVTLARIYTVKPPYTYGVVALILLLLVSVHTVRKDKTFLQILGIRSKLLYLAEYHLLVSPVYLEFLLNRRWIEILSLSVMVSVVPFLNLSLSRRSSRAGRLGWIPSEAFEWKSGLRKQGWLIGLLYMLALGLYRYPYVAFMVIVMFTFIVTTFYNESEPRLMVEVFAHSPSAFLFMKGSIQLTLFWLGCLPLMLIFLWSNADYWYVLLVLFMVSSTIQLLSIQLKYSFYEPGRSFNKDVFMFIYVMSLFVPFFVPVPLVMLFYYYRKARLNLQSYLP